RRLGRAEVAHEGVAVHKDGGDVEGEVHDALEDRLRKGRLSPGRVQAVEDPALLFPRRVGPDHLEIVRVAQQQRSVTSVPGNVRRVCGEGTGPRFVITNRYSVGREA